MDESAPVFFVSDVDAELCMFADPAVSADEVVTWCVTLVRPDGHRERVEPSRDFIAAHETEFDTRAPHWHADHPTGSWFEVERPAVRGSACGRPGSTRAVRPAPPAERVQNDRRVGTGRARWDR